MGTQAYWVAVHHITSLDKRFKVNRKVGWIYAFTNKHFTPQMYKIGETSRPPHLRLNELSSQTGVPFPFEPAYFVHVLDRKQAERHVHTKLAEYRVADNNEFFTAPLPLVKSLFDNVSQALPVHVGKGKRAMLLPQPFARTEDETEPAVSDRYTIECIGCLTENRIPNPETLKSATCGKCGLVLPIHV